MEWRSPYLEYMKKIRQEVTLYRFPPSKKIIDLHLTEVFVSRTNESIDSLSSGVLEHIDKFSKAAYVCDGSASAAIARSRYGCAGKFFFQ